MTNRLAGVIKNPVWHSTDLRNQLRWHRREEEGKVRSSIYNKAIDRLITRQADSWALLHSHCTELAAFCSDN